MPKICPQGSPALLFLLLSRALKNPGEFSLSSFVSGEIFLPLSLAQLRVLFGTSLADCPHSLSGGADQRPALNFSLSTHSFCATLSAVDVQTLLFHVCNGDSASHLLSRDVGPIPLSNFFFETEIQPPSTAPTVVSGYTDNAEPSCFVPIPLNVRYSAGAFHANPPRTASLKNSFSRPRNATLHFAASDFRFPFSTRRFFVQVSFFWFIFPLGTQGKNFFS